MRGRAPRGRGGEEAPSPPEGGKPSLPGPSANPRADFEERCSCFTIIGDADDWGDPRTLHGLDSPPFFLVFFCARPSLAVLPRVFLGLCAPSGSGLSCFGVLGFGKRHGWGRAIAVACVVGRRRRVTTTRRAPGQAARASRGDRRVSIFGGVKSPLWYSRSQAGPHLNQGGGAGAPPSGRRRLRLLLPPPPPPPPPFHSRPVHSLPWRRGRPRARR